jgi:hypothetical protein
MWKFRRLDSDAARAFQDILPARNGERRRANSDVPIPKDYRNSPELVSRFFILAGIPDDAQHCIVTPTPSFPSFQPHSPTPDPKTQKQKEPS